jgi:very-short-patch-repair endonuclease
MLEIRRQPAYRKKQSESLQEVWKRPDYREKQSVAQHEWRIDPDRKSKHTEAMNRPETREKLRNAATRQWAEMSEEERRQRMRKIKKTLTGGKLLTQIEAEVLMALNDFDMPYLLHKRLELPEKDITVDIIIPAIGLVIECDGQWYHSSAENQAIDNSRDILLQQNGYLILRLSESQIKDGTFIDSLQRALHRKGLFDNGDF